MSKKLEKGLMKIARLDKIYHEELVDSLKSGDLKDATINEQIAEVNQTIEFLKHRKRKVRRKMMFFEEGEEGYDVNAVVPFYPISENLKSQYIASKDTLKFPVSELFLLTK